MKSDEIDLVLPLMTFPLIHEIEFRTNERLLLNSSGFSYLQEYHQAVFRECNLLITSEGSNSTVLSFQKEKCDNTIALDSSICGRR